MIPTRMFPLNIVGTFLEDNVPIGRDFKERDDEVLCNVVCNERECYGLVYELDNGRNLGRNSLLLSLQSTRQIALRLRIA